MAIENVRDGGTGLWEATAFLRATFPTTHETSLVGWIALLLFEYMHHLNVTRKVDELGEGS